MKGEGAFFSTLHGPRWGNPPWMAERTTYSLHIPSTNTAQKGSPAISHGLFRTPVLQDWIVSISSISDVYAISCQYIARTLPYPNQWEGDTATRKPRRLKQRPQSSEPATSWTHKNEQPNSQSQVFARLQLTTHSFVRNSSLHASNSGFCFWELYLLHVVIFLESLKSLCKCVGDSSWHLSKFWKRWQTD